MSSLFPGFEEKNFSIPHAFLGNVIIDRGSKYSVSGGYIRSSQEANVWMTTYLADKYFRKATHNIYAYRIREDNGFIIEKKDDDGETGAGQAILTQLQRANIINGIVVVTRYYGGKKLYADRFRHVVDATTQFIASYT